MALDQKEIQSITSFLEGLDKQLSRSLPLRQTMLVYQCIPDFGLSQDDFEQRMYDLVLMHAAPELLESLQVALSSLFVIRREMLLDTENARSSRKLVKDFFQLKMQAALDQANHQGLDLSAEEEHKLDKDYDEHQRDVDVLRQQRILDEEQRLRHERQELRELEKQKRQKLMRQKHDEMVDAFRRKREEERTRMERAQAEIEAQRLDAKQKKQAKMRAKEERMKELQKEREVRAIQMHNEHVEKKQAKKREVMQSIVRRRLAQEEQYQQRQADKKKKEEQRQERLRQLAEENTLLKSRFERMKFDEERRDP